MAQGEEVQIEGRRVRRDCGSGGREFGLGGEGVCFKLGRSLVRDKRGSSACC